MATPRALLISFLLILGLFPLPNTADFALYSNPPQSLLPGQNLTYDLTPHDIPYGPHVLSLQPDCNLVRYNFGKLTWSTNTSGLGSNCYLTVLPDGELVIRHNFHYPVWSSGVKSDPGNYTFLLQWDGSLGVFGPELWYNSDEVSLSNSEMMITTTDYVIYSYQYMPIGLILSYKNFRVVLRDDCNMVLEDTDTWEIKWQTNTSSPYHDCFTYLDASGEFFLKHNRREILWSTGKRSPTPSVYPNVYILVLRYDGRLVIYHPQIWAVAAGAKGEYSGVARGLPLETAVL